MTNYETLKLNEAMDKTFYGQAEEFNNALQNFKREILEAIRPICEPVWWIWWR